jgi:hypothetical protein
MPIEIRELVIRATVDPKAEAHGSGSPSSKEPGQSASRSHAEVDADVVEICVREVLRILEDKRER